MLLLKLINKSVHVLGAKLQQKSQTDFSVWLFDFSICFNDWGKVSFPFVFVQLLLATFNILGRSHAKVLAEDG